MAEDLSSIINSLDRRVRQLETKGVSSAITSALIVSGGTVGQYLRKVDSTDYNAAWTDGFVLQDVLTYTSSSSLDLTTYPDARALRVIVQGGGGGGGSAGATAANETGIGGGGGGGGCIEAFVLTSELTSSIYVTVGSGGAAVSGAAGTAGGASWFGGVSNVNSTGAYLIGYGGSGGNNGTATAAPLGRTPGSGGSTLSDGTTTFYYVIEVPGSPGQYGIAITQGEATPDYATYTIQSAGGGSRFSPPTKQLVTNTTDTYQLGQISLGYGGGGGGGNNAEGETQTDGGDGSSGLVIVEVYV